MVRQNAGTKRHCKTKPGVKATRRRVRASESSLCCHQRAGADQRHCREKEWVNRRAAARAPE